METFVYCEIKQQKNKRNLAAERAGDWHVARRAEGVGGGRDVETRRSSKLPRRSGAVPTGGAHFSTQGPLHVLPVGSEPRLRHYHRTADWHRIPQRGMYTTDYIR